MFANSLKKFKFKRSIDIQIDFSMFCLSFEVFLEILSSHQPLGKFLDKSFLDLNAALPNNAWRLAENKTRNSDRAQNFISEIFVHE